MFRDRKDAGAKLAARLLQDEALGQTAKEDLLVLSIPRGGVVVGMAVAEALHCDHDVVVVKKVGFPGYEELAIGAVAEDGLAILDDQVVDEPWLEPYQIERQIERTQAKVADYTRRFRQGRKLDPQGKTVIVVDDGIATGETMKVAVRWLTAPERPDRPKRVIVAVPVCPPRAVGEFEGLADQLICLETPRNFWAVSQFYQEFDQVSDDEVAKLLTPVRSEQTA